MCTTHLLTEHASVTNVPTQWSPMSGEGGVPVNKVPCMHGGPCVVRSNVQGWGSLYNEVPCLGEGGGGPCDDSAMSAVGCMVRSNAHHKMSMGKNVSFQLPIFPRRSCYRLTGVTWWTEAPSVYRWTWDTMACGALHRTGPIVLGTSYILQIFQRRVLWSSITL